MKAQRDYQTDWSEACDSVAATAIDLATKFPDELVVVSLLTIAGRFMLELDEFEQLEMIGPELSRVRGIFQINAYPYLSNEVDRDLEAEKYNKRYARSG